jgi:hypothetical protein
MSKLILSSIVYDIYKSDVVLHVQKLCNKCNSSYDYTLLVIRLIDDFFSKTKKRFHDICEFDIYVDAITIASVWIIDKHVEDEHMELEDVRRICNRGMSKRRILQAEWEIFFLCKSFDKYVPRRKSRFIRQRSFSL